MESIKRGIPPIFMEAAEGRLHYVGWCICLCACMCFILICVGMFHVFLNIFDMFIYMFDMLIDISICLLIYIYIYIFGPRGVIWNLVVRASFFHNKFEIPWTRRDFFSIHINFFMRIQWNGSRYLMFGYLWSEGSGFDVPKGVFSRNKRICS